MHQILTQIIILAVVFGLFFYATADKMNNRGIKRQVLEKELALLIDSARPGTEIYLDKEHPNGIVSQVELREHRVYVNVNGLPSIAGHPYLTKYSVEVSEEERRFKISIT